MFFSPKACKTFPNEKKLFYKSFFHFVELFASAWNCISINMYIIAVLLVLTIKTCKVEWNVVRTLILAYHYLPPYNLCTLHNYLGIKKIPPLRKCYFYVASQTILIIVAIIVLLWTLYFRYKICKNQAWFISKL